MKKLAIILLFISSIFCKNVLAQHFWQGKLMPSDQIKKLWGVSKFNKKSFRNGLVVDRPKMSYDLIQSKIYW